MFREAENQIENHTHTHNTPDSADCEWWWWWYRNVEDYCFVRVLPETESMRNFSNYHLQEKHIARKAYRIERGVMGRNSLENNFTNLIPGTVYRSLSGYRFGARSS